MCTSPVMITDMLYDVCNYIYNIHTAIPIYKWNDELKFCLPPLRIFL